MAQQKRSYNRELFKKFCNEQNIALLKDYSNEKITSKTIVEAKCNTSGCIENVKKPFMAMYLFSIYCTPCTKNNAKEKSKKTCLEKYGVVNPFQSEENKKKIKATCLEKYGVENAMKLDATKEKYKKTCLEKYGCENTFQNEELKKKMKETCLQKYGVESATKLQETQNKKIATCLEKYGVESVNQLGKKIGI